MMQRKESFLRTALLPLIFFVLFLSECSDQKQANVPKHKRPGEIALAGGIYHTPLLNNPKSLDPALAEDLYSQTLVQQLFDGLVRFSPDLLIVPALAENWQIEGNGRLYRFHLRDNARFHNGAPVTTQDVVFSLCRLVRSEPPSSILPHLLKIHGAREYRSGEREQLDGVSIVDDRDLRIRLEEPYAPFLAALAMFQAKVVPRDELLRKGAQFDRAPVGSGAFRILSWDDGKSIRLQRFPDYYSGPAYLDEIEYLIYPGGAIEQAFADFEQGKLEDMPVYGKVRQPLLAMKDIQWFHRPSLSLLFYGLNCQHPALNHPDVRKALSLAIDRNKLIAAAYDGQFEVARSILPPGILGYSPENLKVVDDLARAQKYLEGALGQRVAMLPTLEVASAVQSPVAKAELEFIGTCWSQLGITLVPKFIPNWAEFERHVQSEALQVYRYVWFADIPDPDSILQPLFGSDSNVNYMRYRNDTVDQMLRVAGATIQPAERAPMYQKIENLVLETLPLVPLVHLSIDRVYQANVRGVQLNALGDHALSLHRVWLDKTAKQ
jgi:oligopeptide transport system substrate-binding protein